MGIFCPEVTACYAALNNGAEPPAIGRGALRIRRGGASSEQSPEALPKGLYADPGNTTLLRSLAIAYADQGKMELASLVLHRCLEKNPEDAQSKNLVGLIRLLQGEDQEAYGIFQKVLEMDPGMDEARANLVVLNEGYGNFQRAKQSLAEIADRQTLLSARSSCVHPDFLAAASRLEIVAFDGSEIEALEKE